MLQHDATRVSIATKMDEFEKLCRENGLPLTVQRRAVLEALCIVMITRPRIRSLKTSRFAFRGYREPRYTASWRPWSGSTWLVRYVTLVQRHGLRLNRTDITIWSALNAAG